MKTTTPSLIYLEKVDNLYMDKVELDTITHIYIEKVESLHMGKSEPATMDTTSCNKQLIIPSEPPTKPTLTNSQLVLACYYILASWGIRPRINVDIAHIARFMHLATGKPYNSVHNSDFYKKLQQVPNFKSDRGLIKDLEVIQNIFLHLELKEASLLVDKELTIARREVNNR